MCRQNMGTILGGEMRFNKLRTAAIILFGVFFFAVLPVSSEEQPVVLPENVQSTGPAPVSSIPTRASVKGQIADLDKMVKNYYLGESNMDELIDELIEKEKTKNDISLILMSLENDLSEEKEELSRLESNLRLKESELNRLKTKKRNLALGLYMAEENWLSPLMLSQIEGSDAAAQGASLGIGGLREDWREVSDEVDTLKGQKERIEKNVVSVEESIRSTRMSVASVDARIVTIKQEMIDESQQSDKLLSRGLVKQEAILASLRAIGSPASAGKNPVLTIMGEPVLTPEELVVWFQRDRGPLIVGENDVASLARIYIEEGNRIGVRGDMAFIQATLETGNFVYTGKNNFAGIGHCDDCPRGFPYETPVDGVRAQLQLLRGYADSTVTRESLPWESLPGVGVDRLGVKGCCYTWWGLSGVWASALHYGGTMLSMYDQALAVNGKSDLRLPSESASPAIPVG